VPLADPITTSNTLGVASFTGIQAVITGPGRVGGGAKSDRAGPDQTDRASALLREAFTLTGDLQIIGTTLHVRLDPASAPRRSKALAALCAELTETQTRYPGTDLTLKYSVKGHAATT